MKKMLALVFTIVSIMLYMSCENDGGDSVINLQDGVVPNMEKITTTDQIIDLVTVTNGDPINLGFSASIAQGSAATTDIVGVYTTATGSVYNGVLFSDITLPNEFSLSADDIVNAFTELNNPSDLLLADVLVITARFTMTDGTVLNLINEDGSPNLSSNIRNTVLFSTSISYPVSCPSDIGGNYTVVSSGFSTDGAPVNNPIVNFSYDVVVSDNGGGSYTISDGVAGVYQDWYCVPYGYCFETEGSFTDVCGTLSGTWTESFGCEINLTGVINMDRTLTITWANCFGDTIEEAIYTLK